MELQSHSKKLESESEVIKEYNQSHLREVENLHWVII